LDGHRILAHRVLPLTPTLSPSGGEGALIYRAFRVSERELAS
jgi:hypothetical protein